MLESTEKDSKHPHREDMLLCFMDIRDEEVDAGNSADWTHTMDRGGLCKVRKSTFMTFYEMERKVRQHLTLQEQLTPDLHKTTMLDESVLLHWSMVTVEIDEEPAAILLGKLAELYVTVRGFSFAKTIVEQYKQVSKKSTQKSKALRKNLPK